MKIRETLLRVITRLQCLNYKKPKLQRLIHVGWIWCTHKHEVITFGLCVCVWERDRERQRERMSMVLIDDCACLVWESAFLFIYGTLTIKVVPFHVLCYNCYFPPQILTNTPPKIVSK